MASKLSFVIFLLCLISVISSSSGRRQKGSNKKDYDSLKLSVNWSPTVCRNFMRNGTETTCSLCKSPKAVNKWTIHGLWPSKGQGFGPFQCSNTPFDPTLLSEELKSQLRSKWPSLNFNSDEKFWSHEWKKHGTCASNLNGTLEYFSKTVQLYDQHNVGNALEEAAILPNKNYQLDDIQKVLKKSFGVNVFVACVHKKGIKQQILSEIRLCFDKSLQLTNCGHDNRNLSNCHRQMEIAYPKSC